MGNRFVYPEVDLSGKVAMVTGGNTGIGYETAKGLARLGAHTFIACRSRDKAQTAIEQMKNELLHAVRPGNATTPDHGGKTPENMKANTLDQQRETIQREAIAPQIKVNIEYLPLDLASFRSTKECVRLFKERDLPLHILINNAAVAYTPYDYCYPIHDNIETTEDNFELQFQTNYLSPVLFTLELLPVLLDTASSCGDVRVLFLSSSHLFIKFDINKLNQTKKQYSEIKAYKCAKLYNIMAGYCFQRRLKDSSITVSSVNPGLTKTNLLCPLENDCKFPCSGLLKCARYILYRTPQKGAAASLNCAVNPKLNSSQHFYYFRCAVRHSSAVSRNETFQEQLWQKTMEYLKDHLSPETYSKYRPKENNITTEEID